MMQKIQALIEKLQRTRLVRANTHLSSKGGEIYAAGMSFQALFATFAALFVCFSVFGAFLRGNQQLLQAISDSINRVVPGLVGTGGIVDLHALVSDAALTWSGIIGAGSLIMVIITWFTSTRTVLRLIHNLTADQKANSLLLKLKDFAIALAFGLLIIVASTLSLAVSAVTTVFGSLLGQGHWLTSGVGALLRYGVLFLVSWLVLFAIHKWLAQLPYAAAALWRGTLPGAAGLTVLFMLGSALLGGATKNPLLASFAVLIALLLWFNFVSRLLLLTSSWVAVGADKQLGLPPKLLAAVKEQEATELAAARAGIVHTAQLQLSDLEPAMRLQHREQNSN